MGIGPASDGTLQCAFLSAREDRDSTSPVRVAGELIFGGADQAGRGRVSAEAAMESMKTPWLDAQQATRSMAGFAEIQGIGHALRSLPLFDDSLAAALRRGLGDWRDQITWPPEIFTDLETRSDFYVSLGFNPALTDFPPPAFEQSLVIAGLPRELPPSVKGYGPAGPPPENGDEEEAGAHHAGHDCLQRLERLLRKFINEEMTQRLAAIGPSNGCRTACMNCGRRKSGKRNTLERRIGHSLNM